MSETMTGVSGSNGSGDDPGLLANVTTLTQKEETLQLIVRSLHLYFPPAATAVGIVSNVIAITLLRQRAFRLLTSASYLTCLILMDSVHLIWIFHQWLTAVNGVSVYVIGGWCQFVTFVVGVAVYVSVWVTVALATERFLATYYRHMQRSHCRLANGRIVCLMLVVAATVVYLNTSLLYSVHNYQHVTICGANPAFLATVNRLQFADSIINGLLPYGIILGIVLLTLCAQIQNRCVALCSGSKHSHSQRLLTRSLGRPGNDSLDTESGCVRTGDSSHTRACLGLLVLYLVLGLPYQLFRVKEGYDTVWKPSRQGLLRPYLIQETLKHVHYLKLTLNLWILLAFDGNLRQALSGCVVRFSGNKARARTPEDIPMRARDTTELEDDASPSTEILPSDLWKNTSCATTL